MLGGKLVAASKLKILIIVVGVVTLSIGGAWTAGLIGAPSVAGVENRFGDVNGTTTTIESEVNVHNPNPVSLRVAGLTIDYAVEMNGIRMATGGRDGVKIEQQGNSTIPLTTEMANEKLPAWWASHVRNGENTSLVIDASIRSELLNRTYEPQITRSINTSIIAAFNSDEEQPIEANLPAFSDPALWLNSTSGSWGHVDDETTEIDMAFDLYNPNPAPVVITNLGYEIRMNEVVMGAGSTDTSTAIAPGSQETVYATTRLENENLDDWWVTHLQTNQTTQLEVEFYAQVDFSAIGGGTKRIPLDTYEQTIETDMFGTKAASDTGADADSGTPGDPSTAAENDGSETESNAPTPTASPTETPTASPTPTRTETDDGLL
jgi:LEA14-like dessication related protein